MNKRIEKQKNTRRPTKREISKEKGVREGGKIQGMENNFCR